MYTKGFKWSKTYHWRDFHDKKCFFSQNPVKLILAAIEVTILKKEREEIEDVTRLLSIVFVDQSHPHVFTRISCYSKIVTKILSIVFCISSHFP